MRARTYDRDSRERLQWTLLRSKLRYRFTLKGTFSILLTIKWIVHYRRLIINHNIILFSLTPWFVSNSPNLVLVCTPVSIDDRNSVEFHRRHLKKILIDREITSYRLLHDALWHGNVRDSSNKLTMHLQFTCTFISLWCTVTNEMGVDEIFRCKNFGN